MTLSYLRPLPSRPDQRLDSTRHHEPRRPLEAADILHLAELVPVVRERFAVDCALPDDSILASLRAIAGRSQPRDRWQAAFNSNLGHWLALKGGDLGALLAALVALIPSPRS